MRRLHQLTEEELFAWKEARKAVGWQIYGQDSYRRYNLVDVMEEVMDAEVILDRFEERPMREMAPGRLALWYSLLPVDYKTLSRIRFHLAEIKSLLQQLDRAVPDYACTDEAGGERIWWKSSTSQA